MHLRKLFSLVFLVFMAPVHLICTNSSFSVNLPTIPLHFLSVQSLHWAHQMEFLPTHFLHIKQVHLLEMGRVLPDLLLTGTLIFAKLILRLFDSRFCFHTRNLFSNFINSAIAVRSSAYHRHHGLPVLNPSIMVWRVMIMTRTGLRA